MAVVERQALSLRGIEREYGVDRATSSRAIRSGALPEARTTVLADPWHVPTSARRAAALNGCCPKRVARAIEHRELPRARSRRRWFRVTPAAVRDWLHGRSQGADASARRHAQRVVDRVLGRHTSRERLAGEDG